VGLAERRIAKEFQENHLPALKRRVDIAAGVALPLEVNWEQLTANEYSHAWLEEWPQLYFEPLIAALEQISVDEMGREAVKQGLHRVVVEDGDDNYSEDRWATLSGGVLTLNYRFTSGNAEARTKWLVRALEKAL